MEGRSAASNPFTPGFGNLPRVFAGRKGEFADLQLMVDRLAAGIYEQPRLVTGDRGVGKTALLREFEDEQNDAGRWVVRGAATPGGTVSARLTGQLAEVLDRRDVPGRLSGAALQGIRRLAGVEIGPRGLAVDCTTPPTTTPADRAGELARLLIEAARLARERGTVLLVLVDEAQNIDRAATGNFFSAVQEAQMQVVIEVDRRSGARLRHSLPIGVVVAGLPGLVAHLGAAGSTFGERSKPVELGVFDDADLREGLRAFATAGGGVFDADALELVMEASGGYPYFLHVVGSHVWNAGTGSVVTRADAEAGIAAASAYLDAFYEERLRGLGERQRQYLDAAARLDPADRTPGRIAEQLGTSSRRLASTWQSLVGRHGLLRSAGGDGRLAFALPGLDAYFRRSPR